MCSLSLQFHSDPGDLAWYATVQEELTVFASAARLEPSAEMLLPSAVVEAINNIIQHAYRNESGQPITLTAEHAGGGVTVVLRDRGGPMPLPLPSGALPDDAAESGRGWRIIRSVFPDAHYRRDGDENILTLCRPGTAATVRPDDPASAPPSEHQEKHP